MATRLLRRLATATAVRLSLTEESVEAQSGDTCDTAVIGERHCRLTMGKTVKG
jgi:hypothetical protein